LKTECDIFIDTTGAAFSYPFVKLIFGSYIIAYIHYPIISTDMLNVVRNQRPSYNNDSRISTNIFISYLKLLYYLVFAKFYRFVGRYSNVVIVNSSWTENHISQLWGIQSTQQIFTNNHDIDNHSKIKMYKVYPPCNVTEPTHYLRSKKKKGINRIILSLAQFRPEKDHMLQLRAFKLLKDNHPRR
jgi:alpha-1,2-mannosyltransferase